MKKEGYLLAADGMEEVEGLTVVDLLRRDGIGIRIVSVQDTPDITGARGIRVGCDLGISEIKEPGDFLVLPGGQPGVTNLGKSDAVRSLIQKYADEKKLIAAICAAPTLLGNMGLLQGKKATCYPGLEKELTGAVWTGAEKVTEDAPFVTSRGVGTAIPFALRLITILDSRKAAEKIAGSVVYEGEDF